MGEGQHTQAVAAPRPVSVIRADLGAARRCQDFDAVGRLEQELSRAADQATHLTGGKRGD